jgi:hypothetical protein
MPGPFARTGRLSTAPVLGLDRFLSGCGRCPGLSFSTRAQSETLEASCQRPRRGRRWQGRSGVSGGNARTPSPGGAGQLEKGHAGAYGPRDVPAWFERPRDQRSLLDLGAPSGVAGRRGLGHRVHAGNAAAGRDRGRSPASLVQRALGHVCISRGERATDRRCSREGTALLLVQDDIRACRADRPLRGPASPCRHYSDPRVRSTA